ncbi:MAG: class II aldolase/adducin family protein [Propionibacteriaceae bacterium]
MFEECPAVYHRMVRWVEAADWIGYQLCGRYITNPCTRGDKGQFRDGMYPPREFLDELAPGFAGFACDSFADDDSGLAPSSDAASHAYVTRGMREVGGIVHTYSTYAAWAAVRKPIPCVLTMVGDEVGDEIPIGPFELISDEAIGRGIVEHAAAANASSPSSWRTTAPSRSGATEGRGQGRRPARGRGG